MRKAPIALFVYKRPWHTPQMAELLHINNLTEESNLYVFSDTAFSSMVKIHY